MRIAFPCQAEAAWQWHNHFEANTPHGKKLVRISWDETALCLHQGDKAGNIFVHKGHDAMQKVSLSARRCYITHVALVCDDPVVQAALPQIVSCNERTLPAAMHAELQAALGTNFILLRGSSAWVNTELTVRILGWIAKALQPFLETRQPLVLFDAYKAHIGAKAFFAAARHKIWLLIVPAGMTWLLQVLDTHIFRAYKACLRNAYQLHCIRQGLETHSLTLLLASVREATAAVINGEDWSAAFAKNGFGQLQSQVRPRIWSALKLDIPLVMPTARPTEAQVRVCFPRKTKVFYKPIWRTLDTPVVAVPKVAPAKAVAVVKAGSIASRTRSKAK